MSFFFAFSQDSLSCQRRRRRGRVQHQPARVAAYVQRVHRAPHSRQENARSEGGAYPAECLPRYTITQTKSGNKPLHGYGEAERSACCSAPLAGGSASASSPLSQRVLSVLLVLIFLNPVVFEKPPGILQLARVTVRVRARSSRYPYPYP